MLQSLNESARPQATRVTVGLQYERPVPPRWAARLREVSPPSREHGHLQLAWEPGDIWRPVERWMIGEVLDPMAPYAFGAVHMGEIRELEGPSPRTYGHICTEVPTHHWRERPPLDYQPCLCRHKTETWRKGPCWTVTLTQWRFYQKTRLVWRPFWVIQGANGGHKFDFTSQERMLLEAEGYPTDAPPPGSLPYAPFDERVVRQIERFNRLRKFRNDLRRYRKAMGAEGFGQEQAEADRTLRAHLVKLLADQMQGAEEYFRRGVKHGEHLNLRRSKIDYDRLQQESEAAYVETGELLHESTARLA